MKAVGITLILAMATLVVAIVAYALIGWPVVAFFALCSACNMALIARELYKENKPKTINQNEFTKKLAVPDRVVPEPKKQQSTENQTYRGAGVLHGHEAVF